jgi:hypothetical protein
MGVLSVAGAWVTPFSFLLLIALWLVALVHVVRRASSSRDAPTTLARKALLVELVGLGAFVASMVIVPPSFNPAVPRPPVFVFIPFVAYVVLAITGLVMAIVAADRGEQRGKLIAAVLLAALPWFSGLAFVYIMLLLTWVEMGGVAL